MNYNLVKELCLCYGASGREKNVKQLIEEKISPFCKSIETDAFGNLFCKKTDDGNLLNVVIDAHTDTIGLVVKEVLDGGFLKFSTLGGIDARVLPGAEVIIHSKQDILGVITSVPPHLMSEEDKKKSPKIKDMFIDTGLDNAKEIVSVGDIVTYKQRLDKIAESIMGTYLDDRACVGAVIEVFEKLKDVKLPFNLIASFSVQEEIGLLGAKAQKLNPDVLIALDVTHGKTPDEKSDLVFECGNGSAVGFGPSLDKNLYEFITGCAKKHNILYQTEIIEANSGTNAWGYQISQKPAVCAVLSLPIKFMHTPVETASVKDYDNLVDLTAEVLKGLTKEKLLSMVEDKILR